MHVEVKIVHGQKINPKDIKLFLPKCLSSKVFFKSRFILLKYLTLSTSLQVLLSSFFFNNCRGKTIMSAILTLIIHCFSLHGSLQVTIHIFFLFIVSFRMSEKPMFYFSFLFFTSWQSKKNKCKIVLNLTRPS